MNVRRAWIRAYTVHTEQRIIILLMMNVCAGVCNVCIHVNFNVRIQTSTITLYAHDFVPELAVDVAFKYNFSRFSFSLFLFEFVPYARRATTRIKHQTFFFYSFISTGNSPIFAFRSLVTALLLSLFLFLFIFVVCWFSFCVYWVSKTHKNTKPRKERTNE